MDEDKLYEHFQTLELILENIQNQNEQYLEKIMEQNNEILKYLSNMS